MLKKIIKIGIYLAFLLPLIFTSQTMFPWHFGKTVLFQILVELLILLVVINNVILKPWRAEAIESSLAPFNKGGVGGFQQNSINRSTPFRMTVLDWLVLAFFASQILAAIFGINPNRSFWGDQQRAQGVFTWLHFISFYFLLRVSLKEKREWHNLGVWILSIAALSGFIAWIGKSMPGMAGIIERGPRLSGLIGNPIFFAGYLIIPAFLGFALYFLMERTNKWRLPCLFGGIFILITLIFTQIRGAFLGFLVGLFVIWILYLFFSFNKKVKKISLIAGLAVLLTVGGAYFFNQKSDFLANKAPAISHLLSISASEETASTRLMAWEIALKAWKQEPVLGWGPENFQNAFDRNYNPEFLAHSFSETVWDKPHSYPLEVLATTGIIGIIFYLAMLAALLSYLFRSIKLSDRDKSIGSIILLGAVIAYIIQGSFSFETSNSLQIWMFTLAFISSSYQKSFSYIKYGVRMAKAKEAVIWLFFAAVIIFIPYGLYKNYSFYRASSLMGETRDAAKIQSLYQWQKSAPQVLEAKVPFLWEQAIFLVSDLSDLDKASRLDKKTLEMVSEPTVSIFQKEINKQPDSYLFRFWLGQLYGFMGEYLDTKYYEEARKVLEEAAKLSPDRQQILLLIAKNYLLQNKTKDAIKVLEELVNKDPKFAEPHWFLGLALIQDAQEARGVVELEKGSGFGESFDGNILYMIDLYAKRKEYKKIVPLYEKLISRQPQNASYYASLAATYAALGDKEGVILNLNKAVELDPALAPEAKLFLEQNGIK